MQLPTTFNFPGLTQNTLSSFLSKFKQAYQLIALVLNSNISFGDGTSQGNISGSWVSVTTPVTPDTDFTLTHGLNRIPVGYLVMTKSAACDVYTGSVAATASQITLRASVGSVNLNLFII